MSSIKQFNVKINGGTPQTFDVGVNATNVDFSDEAAAPFNNTALETFTPEEINRKASNIIYGGAYIRNNSPNSVDTASAEESKNGNKDYTNRDDENQSSGTFSISYGIGSLGRGHHSVAIGYDCEAQGWSSHAEGYKTFTGNMSNYAHAEGAKTQAKHNATHAEGDETYAGGFGSHTEGRGTFAYGVVSHAEGKGNIIGAKDNIVRENSSTIHRHETLNDVDVELTDTTFKQYINGQGSHAEGLGNTVKGAFCHAEGIGNTIETVYGSTAMGEGNVICSNNCVIMGSHNNIGAGYDNAVIMGKYSNIKNGEEPLAFAIGGGVEGTPSNLISIRYPSNGGAASQTNRASLWGENLNAHFKTVTLGPLHVHGDSSKGTWRCTERPLLMYPLESNLLSFEYDSHYGGTYTASLLLDSSVAWKSDAAVSSSYSIFPDNCMFSKATINGVTIYGGTKLPFVITCTACCMQTGRDGYQLLLTLDGSGYQKYLQLTRDTSPNPMVHTSCWCDIVVYGYTW